MKAEEARMKSRTQVPRITPFRLACVSCDGWRTMYARLEGHGPGMIFCEDCAGTGREPIPFSEVWGL